ncbi:hypothetical protein JNUCC1_00768 [Lentibacillus sp. JNUCC-1]|uniref:hypothetical protein n=1 Tax=Lentibacillus sp. JNUCC-1 TaxID=2654513 RepID=UPI0012E90FA6|nr:hypothetical protein [Lentibacillus sp. JNUCC-1]MUV36962.1 hypothetical protein [Lentibacillus sp. JNUCC-1]
MRKNDSRKLFFDDSFEPFPVEAGDEVFRNGIFRFNITRMIEDIERGALEPVWRDEDKATVTIKVAEWYRPYEFRPGINEAHLPMADLTKPVIQVEFNPGIFKIIDGNHRMEKALRDDVPTIESYKLSVSQLLPYFAEKRAYEAFVDYWNSKLL